MSTRPAQLGYPAVVLLIDRQDNRHYQAVAICADEDCDLDRDVAPCCYLGQHGRPRYRVDGVERSDFDPTIPNDLVASGWFWHGSFLAQIDQGVTVMVGMPLPSLDEVWKQARKLDAARADLAAGRAADAERKAEKKPTTPPTEAKAAKAPEVVVVPPVAQQATIEQLALF